jgi:lysophospholipase L1-like esterase
VLLTVAEDNPRSPDTDRGPRTATASEPSGAPQAQATSPKTNGASTGIYRVAFMGDSLTDAKAHGGKFITYLRERCPLSRFDNFGKGADMVNQMRARFRQQITASGNYTHVVIFGGVNDLYSDLTAKRTNARIQADLTQMYTFSGELGARVVALTVAPWGGFKRYFNARRGENTLQLNAWIQSQRGGLVQEVVDAHALLRCGDAHLLCPEFAVPFKDGIHFGPKGHETLGRALHQQVFSDCR